MQQLKFEKEIFELRQLIEKPTNSHESAQQLAHKVDQLEAVLKETQATQRAEQRILDERTAVVEAKCAKFAEETMHQLEVQVGESSSLHGSPPKREVSSNIVPSFLQATSVMNAIQAMETQIRQGLVDVPDNQVNSSHSSLGRKVNVISETLFGGSAGRRSSGSELRNSQDEGERP